MSDFIMGRINSLEVKDPKELSQSEVRRMLMSIKDKVSSHPKAVFGGTPECDNGMFPLEHTFADGCYIRRIFMPKGSIVVSKIHKTKHPYFILKGDVSVLTEKGVVRLSAPYNGITEAGTQRVLYMHEDTVWCTCHLNPDNKQDVKKIEDRIIAKSYDELDCIHPAIGEVK